MAAEQPAKKKRPAKRKSGSIPKQKQKLSDRQKRFAAEYSIDYNATQAAIRAGYSVKGARVQGCTLLANPNILAEIERQTRKTAEKLDIKREDILRELVAVGFSRITDFVQVATVTNSLGRSWRTVTVSETANITAEKLGAVAGIKQGANGIEVKLHDKLKALETLAKLLGLFDSSGNLLAEPKNNLLDIIIESTNEELNTDDIPEIEQKAAACPDMVEQGSNEEL